MNFLAKWIGAITDKAIGAGSKNMPKGSPAVYFRKEFNVKKQVQSASLIVAGLGLYLSYINGNQTDSELFKPQWTDYNKRINYQTFDVKNLLSLGDNCIGAILGDGWYCGKLSLIGRGLYGGYPLELFMQLEITYTDGEKQCIISNSSFKASDGNIRENDFQDGEHIDARFNTQNFSKVGFNDSAWVCSTELKSKSHLLEKSYAPPIKYHERIAVKLLHKDSAGRYIYDIGQNLAGNISAQINAPCGSKIVFRYGEMLNADGSLYTENLRSALCTDSYTASGAGNETFMPHFTFHGFRYIEVDCPPNCTVSGIMAMACYSDLTTSGSFSTDNELVNKIYQNAFWGQKSNFVGLPTDCPQRDERMGWTGDTYAFCGSAMFNMDCREFYAKYLNDLLDAQRDGGEVTDVVPYVPIVGYGNNGWGDVITELPYQYYLMYGNKQFLLKYLPAIKRWVDFMLTDSDDCIRPLKGYGDWLSIYNDTNVQAMNTAMFARSAKLLSVMCKQVDDADSEKYQQLFERVKARYISVFIDSNGVVAGGTQGDYILAAACFILPPSAVGDKIMQTINAENGHLSCGFMSIKHLLPLLCETGNCDTAYNLIAKDSYPSWGYSVRQGATTIWERWNSYTTAEGFGNAEMNSFNHYALGSCTEWMYRYALGINPILEGAGFSKALIRPFVDFSGKIKQASGQYNSANGLIAVQWSVEGDKCEYELLYNQNISIATDFSHYNVINEKAEKGSLKVTFSLKK